MRAFFAFALACLMCTAAPRPGGADQVPTAAEILAHVREAAGRPPATERVHIAIVRGDLNGERTVIRRGQDWVETSRVGPFSTARGRLRGYGWHQNENGITVIDGAAGDAPIGDSAASERGASVSVGDANDYVLAELDADGYGTKTFVEPATWRVVRQDTIYPSNRSTVRYDRFQRVAGHERATHWIRDGGNRQDREEDTITADTTDDVKEAEVLVPDDRRTLVEFPAGTQTVTLPARFDRNRIIVRAAIGNRGVDLVLDTGASGISLDQSLIKEAGGVTYGRALYNGIGGTVSGSRSIVSEMRVGSLVMRDVVVATMPAIDADRSATTGSVLPETLINDRAVLGTKIVGLLGFDFIAGLALKIDYAGHTVTAMTAASFKGPGAGAIELPVRLGRGTPQVDVTINGATGREFIVDTGAPERALLVYDRFARAHPDAMTDLHGGSVERMARVGGIGGMAASEPVQLETVVIGKITFKKFVAYRITSVNSAGLDGLIGGEFLRYFDVYTDYQNSRLVLVPNAAGRATYK
jgi:predicted aspartyl protease